MKRALATVEDVRGISASHERFIRELPRARTPARDMVRRTRYWVYDPATRTFSPSKFSGYVAMDFQRYRAAYAGHLHGVKFDGGVTQQAITEILGDYEVDPELARELEAWAQSVLGPDIFDKIDHDKWRFVRLPVAGVGGLAALAGGWEGSDELVDDVLGARRTAGRRPPELDGR